MGNGKQDDFADIFNSGNNMGSSDAGNFGVPQP